MEAIVYKVYYNNILLYVGSTFNFNKRKIHHKSICYNKNSKAYNMHFYQYIRDNNINFDDLEWVVDSHTVKDKEEKLLIERRYIEFFEPLCNHCIPTKTKEEYKEYNKEYRDNNKDKLTEYYKEYRYNNKDKLTVYHKEWYEANKEKHNEKSKEYREANKDRLLEEHKEWYEANKEKIKEYREANKDKMSEYNKKWYENNKEKRKEYSKIRNSITYTCECNGQYTIQHKKRHEKTIKHQEYLTNCKLNL